MYFIFLTEGKPQGIARAGKEYFCLVCGYTTCDKSNANRHFRNLHQAKPERCQICNKVYRTEHYLSNHMAKAHGVTQKMMKNASSTTVPNYEEEPLEVVVTEENAL